jgi:MscS family membrane protein
MIPKLHAKAFPFGTADWVPGWSKKFFLGLMIWQWVGILLYLLIAAVIHEIFTVILSYLIKGIAGRFSKENIAIVVFRKAAKPFSLMFISILLIYFVPTLGLPLSVNRYVMLFLRVMAPVFGVLVFYYLMDVVSAFMSIQAEKTETKLDDNLVPLVRKVLKGIVVVTGLVIILQNLNVNVTALLAGLSIGGLALALAAQDTVKNLFGSLMLYLDQPFKAGDWIIAGDIEGMVEEVGMRSTRIKTFNDYIPNGKLADNWINNMELRVYRRMNTTLQVAPETDPELLGMFVSGMREMAAGHPQVKKDELIIAVHEITSNAIVIRIMIYFSTDDTIKESEARQEILLGYLQLAKSLSVRVAIPGQKLIQEDAEAFHFVSKSVPDSEKLKKVSGDFIASWKNKINPSQN